MSDARWSRLRRIFDEVVELDPTERVAALERLCDGDASLADEVRDLLAASEEEDRFLVPPSEKDAAGETLRLGDFELRDATPLSDTEVAYTALDTRRREERRLIVVAPASSAQAQRMLVRADHHPRIEMGMCTQPGGTAAALWFAADEKDADLLEGAKADVLAGS